MPSDSILFSMFLVFTGASIIATVALFARQALLVAYIALGALLGPWSLDLISDTDLIADIANIGIIFLLFLLGLNLEIAELRKLFREALFVTGVSSTLFAVVGFSVAFMFGFNLTDSLLIGAAMMFSSTIIALKLLPTSALHHQRMGELIVSILLLQDMLAIALLLLLHSFGSDENVLFNSLMMIAGLPLLAVGSYYFSAIVLVRLIERFDRIQEYVFLLAIGWCLGIAELAVVIGLSHEVGAFVAGISLAANPIARFIAESLKPLRDFFLIMFFFALGAGFDFGNLSAVILPAIILAVFSVALKPVIFKYLLRREQERAKMAGETGARLGQISEFSLLIILVAGQHHLIGRDAAALVQTATLLGFVFSSYWVVMRYPTPIAVSDELRRD